MKKLYLLAALALTISLKSGAQVRDKIFKVDIHAGYAGTVGPNATSGALFGLEMLFHINRVLAIGYGSDAVILSRGTSADDLGWEFEAKGTVTGLLTLNYYLSENYSFRPYIGAGPGVYYLGSLKGYETDNGNELEASATVRMGAALRAGFEAKHFRFGLDYHMIPRTRLASISSVFSTDHYVSNSFFGVRVGIVIGGGPN